MTKTFTAQEAIDITYDYGQSSTSQSLDVFMTKAGYKPFKGANSVYIHSPESHDLDLTINIEAYDNDFDVVTSTTAKREQFKERIHKYLRYLFPNMTISITWYSGYNYHQYYTLNTSTEKD